MVKVIRKQPQHVIIQMINLVLEIRTVIWRMEKETDTRWLCNISLYLSISLQPLPLKKITC